MKIHVMSNNKKSLSNITSNLTNLTLKLYKKFPSLLCHSILNTALHHTTCVMFKNDLKKKQKSSDCTCKARLHHWTVCFIIYLHSQEF